MRKIYYQFRECGSLSKALTIATIISFAAMAVIIFMNDIHTWHHGLFSSRYFFSAHHAWILFFFALGIVLIIANIIVHKVCADIAALLKEMDDKK